MYDLNSNMFVLTRNKSKTDRKPLFLLIKFSCIGEYSSKQSIKTEQPATTIQTIWLFSP